MIKFYCPTCQTKLGVPDEFGGKRIRCSKCGQPSIVPRPVKEVSVTPELAKPGNIELQPPQKYEPPKMELPPLDPNAEVLRKASHERTKTSGSSTSAAPNSGKSGIFRSIFQGFQKKFGFGNFYLGTICALLFIVAAVLIWLGLSKLTGLCLEFLFIPTALAPGLGFCVFSRSRGPAIGVLSLLLGILAIIFARVAYVHCFILPEWKKITTSVEITPEYEKLYSVYRTMPFGKSGAYDDVAAEETEMIAVAICSLISDKQMDPLEGIDIYLEIKIPASENNDPNSLNQLFKDSPLAEGWQKVKKRLGQWDDAGRKEAAQKYFYRYLFFQEQCDQKVMLDNYPVAITAAFFHSSNCMFFMLRIVYCVIGLIGAYKTCSEDYFE